MKKIGLLALAVGALLSACSEASAGTASPSAPASKAPVLSARAPRMLATVARVESVVPTGWTVEGLWQLRNPEATTTAATLYVRSKEGNTACILAEHVKGEWVSHRVDLEEPSVAEQCLKVTRINGRWVFVLEYFGGYEASNGNNVDTSWFELFAVVDGEMRRVYPLGPSCGFREVAPGTSLRDKFSFMFVQGLVFLEWAEDGRSIVQLIERRPRRR